MTKDHILNEIRRTAASNRGIALGKARFQVETGISETDWYGKHWVRWSDAIRESGVSPNQMNTALDEQTLLESYSRLTFELGRLPSNGDLLIKARTEKGSPSHNTFRRFGPKVDLTRTRLEYSRAHAGLEEITGLCERSLSKEENTSDAGVTEEIEIGFVYLLRSSRFYKIGKSNSADRRERELTIQLPEKAATVHVIHTGDPSGIEAYWHRRFDGKRKNGEWFELTADDVRAFKRRKFM